MPFLFRFNTIKLMPKSLVPKVVTKQSGPSAVPEEGLRTEDNHAVRTCPPEGRLPCSHLCANSSSSSQLCINSSSNQLIVNSSQLGPGYLTLPRSKVMSDNILLTSPKTKVRGCFPNFPSQRFYCQGTTISKYKQAFSAVCLGWIHPDA